MKTIFTIIFLLCGIFLQAQNIDSLTRAGEHSYHQKDYTEAQNAFYKAYILDRGNPKAVSNLLLVYYKIKRYQSAYKVGHKFLRNTPSIPLQHRANIYHNLALNCEALDYEAEALHYYQKANDIKNHAIRTSKIERLRPVVDQLNAILPEIEKELPEFALPSLETRKIRIPSYHPISASLHDYILKKVEDYHNTFDSPQLDSTLYFYPIRIRPRSDAPLYVLICRVQFPWWKNDYTAKFFVDSQGHIIDIPIANRHVENMLIEDDGEYIINTSYHPMGHGHWSIYTLYHYNTTERKIEQSADFIKHFSTLYSLPFYSNIYIQDNTYRIEYGQLNMRVKEEKKTIGDTWLYTKDSINTIRVPREYEKSFQLYKHSNRFQLLKHVEFY